ncbi:acyltransferase family protein [Sphingopyxis sp. KK2]|uniref:acyltransferase family protein n=1 Tax=Sphingopyxis sp. KK2 TaxID=1855727 RepID=UPI00097E58A1|nr:acyltransferase family protein [Sphingopyxis sp. KK2]
MQYRNDIAGLRALAVLPILLVHAGLTAIPGGFVGVDIFFVISGYLISRIILKEMDGDRFTLTGFYRRRALRILPALLVMLAVVLAVGWWRLFPQDMRDLSWSAAATALSGSNIWFWRTVNYFGDAELTPLLHTWSLGVEEQFYIFYPLLLIALRRWLPRHIVAALWVIAAASLAIGYGLIHINKAAASFYLLPSRAWELALGGLVATGGLPKLGERAKPVAAWLGLAMVVASLFVIEEGMAFPVPWALLPCVGTALLIAYGEAGGTAKLLSLAPMRFVGDISYSLYLWHWPVMAFWRFERGLRLDAGEMAATIAISFALAILSYRLIEQPFLRRGKAWATPRVLWGAVAAMLLVAGVASLLAVQASTKRIANPEVERLLAYLDYGDSDDADFQFERGVCMADNAKPFFDPGLCATRRADRPNILVMGDSHAAHIAQAMAERLTDANVLRLTASGCDPVWPVEGDPRCTNVMAIGFEGRTPGEGPVSRVILSARWRLVRLPGLVRAIELFRDQDIPVTVLGPAVEYEEPLPRLLARLTMRGGVDLAGKSRRLDLIAVDDAMRKAVVAAGGTYVSMQDLECPGGVCPLFASDGSPFHFDYGHYTLGASRDLAAKLPIEAISPAKP